MALPRDKKPSALKRRKENIANRYVGASPTRAAVESGITKEFHTADLYEVELDVAKFGEPREGLDPGDAIMEEIARSAGYVRDIAALIHEKEIEELTAASVVEVHESRTGGQGGDYDLVRRELRREIDALWVLYSNERRHLAQVASGAVKAGLEERRVKLAEGGVDKLEAAFVAALEQLGVDPHDTRVRTVIGQQIRLAIEGGMMPDRSDPHLMVRAERVSPVVPPLPPVDF